MSSTLSGRRILLTRPEGQVEPLAARLRKQGAQVSHFPAISITPVSPAKANLAVIEQADYVVFVSVNAVHGLKATLDKHPNLHLATDIAAIGPATEAALEQAGLEPDVVAPPPHNSEALLSTRHFRDLKHRNITIIRGQSGREKLADELRDRGAEVHYLEVYRRDRPNTELSFKKLWDKPPDAICITSVEIAKNLLECIVPEEKGTLLQCPFIAGNQRILNACLELGYTAFPGIANNPGDDAMFKALEKYFPSGETAS